jgi:hypothetical protein
LNLLGKCSRGFVVVLALLNETGRLFDALDFECASSIGLAIRVRSASRWELCVKQSRGARRPMAESWNSDLVDADDDDGCSLAIVTRPAIAYLGMFSVPPIRFTASLLVFDHRPTDRPLRC